MSRLGFVPLLLAAPDKFRGTLAADEVVGAVARAATAARWEVSPCPLADGGEGLVAVLGSLPGFTRLSSRVPGPLGEDVEARWLVDAVGGTAIVESAQACGLTVAGGASGNDPEAASTAGVGQLVVEAARVVGTGGTVLVGLGGSATTDGGAGLVEVVLEAGGLSGVALVGLVDVETCFVNAARRFGPQKGADSGQVERLERRLVDRAEEYEARFGIDVTGVPGSGAAGGLGGGVLAIGGALRSGVAEVMGITGFPDRLTRADAVLTGEGRLDRSSFEGKVTGAVLRAARTAGRPAAVVAGCLEDEVRPMLEGAHLAVLDERFGAEASWRQAAECVERAVAELLVNWPLGRTPPG